MCSYTAELDALCLVETFVNLRDAHSKCYHMHGLTLGLIETYFNTFANRIDLDQGLLYLLILSILFIQYFKRVALLANLVLCNTLVDLTRNFFVKVYHSGWSLA